MAGDPIRCPKCGGPMPSRRRNGVLIEQCKNCHGIYLDAGEFERLIAIESSQLGDPDASFDEVGTGPQRTSSRAHSYLG